VAHVQKGNRIRLVLIPVLVGLLVTLIAHQVLKAQALPPAAVPVERVPVVVARRSVDARVKLTGDLLAVREVPKEALTGSEYASVDEVAGRITLVPLSEGEPVLKSKVIEEGQGTLPYRIPPGRRAVTVRIDEISGVAGYPDQGDRVDLILVLQPEGEPKPPATARLLLENLLVLARGPNRGEREGEVRISSLTLAVTPEQAVDVALAEQVGLFKVTLRPALAEGNRGSVTASESQWR
jgi:pilus assembly protein CpaB